MRLLTRGLLPALGVVLAVTAALADQPSPMTVKAIMTEITIPSSDAIFMAAYETPANDEQWTAVRRSAVLLRESGELLLKAGHGGDEAWTMLARADGRGAARGRSRGCEGRRGADAVRRRGVRDL